MQKVAFFWEMGQIFLRVLKIVCLDIGQLIALLYVFKYLFTINTLKHITLFKIRRYPTCFGPSGPSSGSVMCLVLKLLVFYIWCCDGMRLGVQVLSACLVDVSVAGHIAVVLWQTDNHSTIAIRPATDTSTRHADIT